MTFKAFDSVREFEKEIAVYSGSEYGVAVDNCTNAIFLCCKYLKVKEVTIPKRTSPAVPSAILHSGGTVLFSEDEWLGSYQLKPYPIFDSALRFRRGMHKNGTFTCLSFHSIKHLKIGKGGMILTDSEESAKWFKRARYLGKEESPNPSEKITMVGWNMYMTPEQASRGLMLMNKMPDNNEDLQFSFPDLSTYEIFKRENYANSNMPSA